MLVYICLQSSTWGTEAEGLGIQGQPQLQRDLESSLGYMRLCRKQKKSHDILIIKGQWVKERMLQEE